MVQKGKIVFTKHFHLKIVQVCSARLIILTFITAASAEDGAVIPTAIGKMIPHWSSNHQITIVGPKFHKSCGLTQYEEITEACLSYLSPLLHE